MSQCGDYEDINFYVINVFYGIVIAVYFLPFKKNHPVDGRGMLMFYSHDEKSYVG